jgi:hypothetical protein
MKFKVILVKGTRTVIADYAKIENGALILRNEGKYGNFPGLVCMFAQGRWFEVVVLHGDDR